ncbi:DUF1569 domain-containing protein [Aequorivita flava]|uniref:DUF1569 domain-containing protein n=1 Tax=Aequorivita flava TaxID=3114371 RepID=A0AB35YQD6_9FLAO
MKSLFDTETLLEIRKRLNALTENSEKHWGKMTVGQMLHHCQGPLNIMLEKKDYGIRSNFLATLFFKKMLYNDSPFKKSLPTARFLKETEPRNFTNERTKLIALLDEFESKRTQEEWNAHPGFGYFTKQQWGQMQYKHLDHHLKQFGE